jgi:hypothetical protein
MRTVALVAALAVTAVAGAWSADYAADGAPSYFNGAPASPAASADGTLELKWDNGTRRWSWSWYTGIDHWVGNDFDLSTLSGYTAVEKFKLYTRDDWPNVGWDGFHVAVFDFGGGVPGARLWPTSGYGYFFKPSGLHGHVWVEVNIGWTCPVTAFVAAMEQWYNNPDCDPYTVDDNTVFLGHSWHRTWSVWEPVSFSPPYDPYRNVMLRVIVSDEAVNVSPTSVGRVKALFY